MAKRLLSRRNILISSLVGTVAGLSYQLLHVPEPPNLSDVEVVSKFVNRYVGDVSAFKDNGGPIVYILDDVHTTTVHRRHFKIISRLNKYLGLGCAGVEGDLEGEVTQESVTEDLGVLLDLQNNGDFHQLAKNESKLFGGEPRKVETLSDYLDVAPLYQFAMQGSRVKLFGLEKKEINEKLDSIEILLQGYSKYFEISSAIRERDKNIVDLDDLMARLRRANTPASEMEDSERICETTKSGLYKEKSECQTKILELTEFLKPHLETFSGQLPPLDSEIEKQFSIYETPFYMSASKIKDRLVLDDRSTTCVGIAKSMLGSSGARQVAIVFGQAHAQQIMDECTKQGLSYIHIGLK